VQRLVSELTSEISRASTIELRCRLGHPVRETYSFQNSYSVRHEDLIDSVRHKDLIERQTADGR
jgi:hypothetical protein